jgi:hypothetical protein
LTARPVAADFLAALRFGAAFVFGFAVDAAFTDRLREVAAALLVRVAFWTGSFAAMDLDAVFSGI